MAQDALHEMLCVLLRNLLDKAMLLDNQKLFLPPKELTEAVAAKYGRSTGANKRTLEVREFDFHLDDIQSSSELANVYMGKPGCSPGTGSHRRHRNKRKK